MILNVSSALMRSFVTASSGIREYSSGNTDFVKVQLFQRHTVSNIPWAGGVTSDQVVSFPSHHLAVDCTFPRIGEPYIRRKKVVQEGSVRVMGKPECEPGEDQRAIDVTMQLVEEIEVPAHKVRALVGLEGNLAEIEKKRDELNKRIQEIARSFNSLCDDVRWQFDTPPKDLIIKSEPSGRVQLSHIKPTAPKKNKRVKFCFPIRGRG